MNGSCGLLIITHLVFVNTFLIKMVHVISKTYMNDPFIHTISFVC